MNRNWKEDSNKFEGQSLNHCNYGNEKFIGKPLRVFCKPCTELRAILKKVSEK